MGRLERGSILHYRNFPFLDGILGDKLVVVLNTPKNNDDPVLFCRTTSKEQSNCKKQGCYSDNGIYVLDANHDNFPEKTWIQFYYIVEMESGDLLSKPYVDIKGKLRVETINAIVNCIKQSEDATMHQLSLLQ
jgi:hypothetical protein